MNPVLVAEDDRVHSMLLVRRLKQHGIASVVAFDAMQAMMLAARTLPSAILLDINMPGGTGLDVLKKLKASSKTTSIPVIAFSATVNEQLSNAVQELGAEGFFSKPIDFQKFEALLAELLCIEISASPQVGRTEGGN